MARISELFERPSVPHSMHRGEKKETVNQRELKKWLAVWRKAPRSSRGLCARRKLKSLGLVVHLPKTSIFKKGCIPWNKGRGGGRVSPRTEFKKGHRPANWKPVGTITVRYDKHTKTPRQFVKVREPKVWERYALYVWKKNGGKKIPPGFVLHHKDLNTMNAEFSNLEVIPRGRMMNIHRRLFESLRRERADAAQKDRWARYRAEKRGA